jgi:hypothetical protein
MKMRLLSLFVAVLMVVCAVSAEAAAAGKKKGKKGGKGAKAKSAIIVPVDLAAGPAGNHFFGALGGQLAHWGLKLDLAAIIDQETIQANKNRIPKKYRKAAASVTEISYRPFWWLPDSLLLSPAIDNTQMWGITWRPVSLGLSLLNAGPLKVSISGGAVLTYAWMAGSTWTDDGFDDDSMHFLRPGVDAKLDIQIALAKSFLVSFGWDSYVYVPQRVGRDFWEELGDDVLDTSVWHNGQVYLLLHFRFPYSTRL